MADHLQQLITRYPSLSSVKSEIVSSFEMISRSFSHYGKLIIAGNGGSAADAEHIVGELMKDFVIKRKFSDNINKEFSNIDPETANYLTSKLQPGLPAISLSNHSSINTACINDIDSDIIFAQQVYIYGNEGDTFLGISTSGNSKNIVYAAATAKCKKMNVIALSGNDGGKIKKFTDVSIIVPEKETYKIQELHLPIYHCLCLMLEEYFFNKKN
jgi:D-sedoheptulose 7-phosphate isomerase